jgi:glycosyltransferase involved in cell wall biosynthesis
MRVAYICNRYPAISMTFVRREVESLRGLGIDVKTLSVRPPLSGDLLAAEDREAAASTYSVLPVKPAQLLGAHLRALATRPGAYARTLALSLRLGSGGARATLWRLFYFAEAIVVWRRCCKERVTHVHSHFANVATDVAMLCAHFADRPAERWSWSFTLHGPVEFYDVYRARLAEKIARARFVICISDFARSQAMAFCEQSSWQKLHVVHCGVDPRQWRAPPPRVAAPPAKGPPGDAPQSAMRLLCVGRLISLKGHAVLIEAIAHLRGEGLEATVTLIGDGAEREALGSLALRSGVKDLVEFAGAVGQDRIREFFTRADAFCLPSFAEGVPVVLMEAMAMELPVVASRIMGIPELVQDGRSGLLVAPGRADELAGAVRRLATDAELCRRLAIAGRARITADYDVEDSAGQIVALMQRYGVGVPAGEAAAARRSADSSRERPLAASGSSALPALAVQNAGPPPGSDGTEA